MCINLRSPEEGVRSPEAGVTSEPPNVGAGY